MFGHLRKNIQNEINPYSANALYLKAYCYLLFDNEGKKALAYFKQVLEMREKLFGYEHPSVGLTYYYIGQCQLNLNEMTKVLTSFLKCLDVFKKVFKNHSNIFIANALDAIADYYDRIDDPQNYSKYRSESLNLKRELFKAKYPDRIYYDYVLKRDKDGEKPTWSYILIENESLYEQSRKFKDIRPRAYGKIIKSGCGFSPPKSISEQLKKEYGYESD